MRIVLDTNVMISALLWRGIPHQLLQAIRQRSNLQLYCSAALLEELADVLTRPSLSKQLAAIGKQEWVAPDHAAYVELAVALAQDVPALERIRGSLRDTMRHSPFLDHPGFARDMGAAYRDMWQQWCNRPATEGDSA